MKRNIIHKQLILEGAKHIDVFDDVFDLSFRLKAFQYSKESFYAIGWGDAVTPEKQPHNYSLHCKLSNDDVNRLGILDIIANTPDVYNILKDLTLEKAIINLSTPSDVNYVHTHLEKKVMLYYVNTDWQDGWHGETQYYTENLKEIQYTSPYTPGRLIIFDGSIPHTIRPQSVAAPHYRFTMAFVFDKK